MAVRMNRHQQQGFMAVDGTQKRMRRQPEAKVSTAALDEPSIHAPGQDPGFPSALQRLQDFDSIVRLQVWEGCAFGLSGRISHTTGTRRGLIPPGSPQPIAASGPVLADFGSRCDQEKLQGESMACRLP